MFASFRAIDTNVGCHLRGEMSPASANMLRVHKAQFLGHREIEVIEKAQLHFSTPLQEINNDNRIVSHLLFFMLYFKSIQGLGFFFRIGGP